MLGPLALSFGTRVVYARFMDAASAETCLDRPIWSSQTALTPLPVVLTSPEGLEHDVVRTPCEWYDRGADGTLLTVYACH